MSLLESHAALQQGELCPSVSDPTHTEVPLLYEANELETVTVQAIPLYRPVLLRPWRFTGLASRFFAAR